MGMCDFGGRYHNDEYWDEKDAERDRKIWFEMERAQKYGCRGVCDKCKKRKCEMTEKKCDKCGKTLPAGEGYSVECFIKMDGVISYKNRKVPYLCYDCYKPLYDMVKHFFVECAWKEIKDDE